MNTRALLLALPLVALAGCTVDNNVSIQLGAICQPPDEADACSFGSTCEAQPLYESFLDLLVTDHLEMLMIL
jgi:hypothetical protein